MKNKLDILIDEYTSPIDLTVEKETSIKEAYALLKQTGYRHLPVVQDGRPIGIVSERDLNILKLFPDDGLCIKNIMFKNPYCIQSGSLMEDVVFHMSEKKIGSALVTDKNGFLTGIFTSTDGLNALLEVIRGDIEE